MHGRHAHLLFSPSGCLVGAVIFVVVDFILGSGGGIVFPVEGDGWSIGGGGVAEGYVVGSYFKVGEGYVLFHLFAVVAFDGMVAGVHTGAAGVLGFEAGAEIVG